MNIDSLIKRITLIAKKERETFKYFNSNYFVISATFDSKYNIISYGTNSYVKTHPLQKRYAIKIGNIFKIFLHAEVSAIVKTKSKPYGLIVLRFDKLWNYCISKPCPICELAIKKRGIKKIIYFENEEIISIKQD